MYERSAAMQRSASQSYPGYSVAAVSQPKQYPNAHPTSSAFSASANPNEDWTKITDLAERRRIQNRIAQRNYRKKLKKRLEDLERRAGSSSASPEQQHEDLPENEGDEEDDDSNVYKLHSNEPRRRSTGSQLGRDCSAERQGHNLPQLDDRSMFSQQYTRQLSTSPPPFSYASLPATDGLYSGYSPAAGYFGMAGNAIDVPMYPQYLQTFHQQQNQNHAQHPHQHTYPPVVSGLATGAPMKQETYNDDEMSPFGISFASMAGVDISAAQTYHDMTAYTPPLSDSFEFSQDGSPPDSAIFPSTPLSMPRTPPMHFYD